MEKDKIREMLESPVGVAHFSAQQEDDFNELLQTMEETDVWKKVKLSEVNITTSLREGMDSPTDILFATTQDEQREIFPVLEEAMFSIKRRARNMAEIMNDLDAEDTADMLNMSWPYLGDREVKLLVRGGNVLGLHSAQYSPISQRELFDALVGTIELGYEDYEFQGATYSHSMTVGSYRVIDEELTEGYIEALEAAGKKVFADNLSFIVSLSTGDSAECSVTVTPSVVLSDKRQVPFSSPMGIEHRGEATVREAAEQFTAMYAYMEEALDGLKRLMDIRINNPESCFYRICRTFKLPLRIMKDLNDWFRKPYMTAHDFYYEVGRLFEDSRFAGLPAERKVQYRNQVSKILMMSDEDWAKADVKNKTFRD